VTKFVAGLAAALLLSGCYPETTAPVPIEQKDTVSVETATTFRVVKP
jgi:hypothetical protein